MNAPHHRGAHRRALFILVVGGWAALGLTAPVLPRLGAQDKSTPKAPGKYLGATGCDGAQCHNKPEAAEHPPYLQEYLSWSSMNEDGLPYDRHFYAWKRLRGSDMGGDDRSPEIMAKLNELEGTNEQAELSERCLTCHGVAVHDYGVGKANPGAAVAKYKPLQGARYKNEEGVSCDGCHGPASNWLKKHDKKDWTIKEWEKLGGKNGGSEKLYDTHGIYYSKDLELWADQCVRCHLKIDTNMLDAGHPDLLPFELFGHNKQVPHWRDYSYFEPAPHLPGAGPSHAAISWAVGQAVTVRSAAEQLQDRATGAHHNQATPEHLAGAVTRLASHWLALKAGLKVLQPAAVDPIDQAVAPILSGTPEAAACAEVAKKVVELVKPLARKLADGQVDKGQVSAIMKALVNDEQAYADAPRAELLMKSLYALDYARLMHTNPDDLVADEPADPVMQAVYEMYGSPDPSTAEFQAALKKARDTLAKE